MSVAVTIPNLGSVPFFGSSSSMIGPPKPSNSGGRTDQVLDIISSGIDNFTKIYNTVQTANLLKKQIDANQIPTIYRDQQGQIQGGATYQQSANGNIFSGNNGGGGVGALTGLGSGWLIIGVVLIVIALLFKS